MKGNFTAQKTLHAFLSMALDQVHEQIVTKWLKNMVNSMIFYPKNTKAAVEVSAYQGRLHTKIEESRIKNFQDMSKQTFEFFSFFSSSFTLEKITVTRKLMLQSS